MENNNLDLRVGEGRSLDEWVEAIEYDLYSIVYEIVIQFEGIL